MLSAQRLLKRALAEKLAFTPMGASQQAAGPGGAPVDPMAAGGPPGAPPGMPPGAPMDPAAMGGAPMDPMAAGGAPMDPMAGGMPPMDPAMGGAPPMYPAMGGMPPMDPAAMGGMPPPPPPEEDVNQASTDVDNDGKPDTMVPLSGMKDFAVGIIEAMKGRVTAPAKQETAKQEAAAAGAAPGPVTGMPGFDPSMIGGPLKTASVLTRLLRK